MAAFGAVLIVDDEPAILAVASMALARVFPTVVTAPNARGAREAWRAREGQFDVLVTDVMMPGGTGFELADSLMTLRRDLRVLFVSGAADPDELRRRLIPGQCVFLPKPFSTGKLVSAVRQLLEAPEGR